MSQDCPVFVLTNLGMDHGQKGCCHSGVLLIVLTILVELLPGGSLHHSEPVGHNAEVSKERLEVLSTASVASVASCTLKRVVQFLLTCKSVDPYKSETLLITVLRWPFPMLDRVGDAQHSFLAAAFCCSLFLLLKSPGKFVEACAIHQLCTKGTKSAAACT